MKTLEVSKKFNRNFFIPPNLIWTCLLIGASFWILSFIRHLLFQSNVYDLGLFDQWVWLLSRGLTPVSSMAGIHVLADHGAWVLYFIAPFYKIFANINWLFLSQSFSLSFTAIPLWILSINSGLSRKRCWLVCAIWWLQPVVFNANLFDFHPEVLAMPVLATSYYMYRKKKPVLWFLLCILALGCRDGLILIIAGMSIEQILRKDWLWAISSALIASIWFLLLNFSLYPSLTYFSGGEKGPTEGALASLSGFFIHPLLELQKIDFLGGLTYILLISIAFLPFWNKKSLVTLSAWMPLVFLNFIALNPSYRTLIHHYNLPIALIGVISIIDGFSFEQKLTYFPWRKITWLAICWFALAKPYFFTGPYLSRLPELKSIYSSMSLIPPESRVMTTSYIAPHLSHRKDIFYPRENIKLQNVLTNIDFLLLNPNDPGWDSGSDIQSKILTSARMKGWKCNKFNTGMEFCRR